MTHLSFKAGGGGFAAAFALLILLGGCAPTPLTLVSAVDLVLTATEEDQEAPSGPISIDQLLANARDASSTGRDVIRPTVTLERAAKGMDGTAYIALGTFLSDLNPAEPHTIVITRGTPEGEHSLADAQFAVLVAQLIERAGHSVTLTVSPAQAAGSLHLAVSEGAA